jgi:Transposase DNA-binding/Transposase Tn5 dimerisation domain
MPVTSGAGLAAVSRSRYEDVAWIGQQFARVDLGDARRARRAQRLALSMLQAPGKGLPQQTQTWGGLKAAYRLLHGDGVTREKLMQPHFQQTLAAAKGQPLTLFVQDTTELDFSSMQHAEGYGPVGNNHGAGLLVHSLLALTPSGEVLGLGAQHSWARSLDPPYKQTETRSQRQVRCGRESDVWPQLLEAVGPVPLGQCWISIGDRGSDSFGYWMRAVAIGWRCLSRIYTNRRTADHSHLISKARELPAHAQMVLKQRARPGQAARTLHLSLAWASMQVLPPRNDPALAKQPPLQVSIVRCWDEQHAVEWLLLATWPVKDLDDAAQCVQSYAQRWSIEEFHKCLKSGCRVESSQLKQAKAVDVLLGFCSIVAVRLLALARLARMQPDELASKHIDPGYLTVLCAMRKLQPATLTVRGYWREVARVGGFLARTRDGDPGWKTLWAGLMQLENWVLAWTNGYETGKNSG